MTWSPEVAARIIPWDSTPRSWAGARLATRTTLFPTSWAGWYHCLIPDTTCRTSPLPRSTFRTSSLLALACSVHSRTFPTLSWTFLKSSIVMVAGAAGTGAGTGAGAGAGAASGIVSSLGFREGLPEVLQDVLDVLDPGRDPEEAVGHAELG